MIRPVIIAFFVFALIAFDSCSRTNEEDFLPKATITISSPVSGSVYKLGDTISVLASCIGEGQLHGYEVSIKREGADETLFFQHHHEHAPSLQVLEQWKNTVSGSADLVVEVSAILDETAHKKSAIIH